MIRLISTAETETLESLRAAFNRACEKHGESRARQLFQEAVTRAPVSLKLVGSPQPWLETGNCVRNRASDYAVGMERIVALEERIVALKAELSQVRKQFATTDPPDDVA